jgi:hypothetical protein
MQAAPGTAFTSRRFQQLSPASRVLTCCAGPAEQGEPPGVGAPAWNRAASSIAHSTRSGRMTSWTGGRAPLLTPPGVASLHDVVHVCSICGRVFASHQALGSHKASHWKPPLAAPAPPAMVEEQRPQLLTHGCHVCGKTFPMGQTLGGHNRCHYDDTIDSAASGKRKPDILQATYRSPTPRARYQIRPTRLDASLRQT